MMILRDKGREIISDSSFIHHKPIVFNLGDYLCTPKHYFKFYSDKEVVIIGGGSFASYGLDLQLKSQYESKIIWGIGSSFDLDKDDNSVKLNIQEKILSEFSLYGTRDIKTNFNGSYFLPCVSVFNTIVDIKIGSETGVFLNFDLRITSKKVTDDIKDYCQKNNLFFGTNNLNEVSFRKEFSRTNKIITNSYHIAYWGLLSGREIILIGYSSKFINLLKMFDIPINNLYSYNRNNVSNLSETFQQAVQDNKFIKLENPKKYKEKFKQLNMHFANKLQEMNIIQAFEKIEQNSLTIFKRTIKYGIYLKIVQLNKKIHKFVKSIIKIKKGSN